MWPAGSSCVASRASTVMVASRVIVFGQQGQQGRRSSWPPGHRHRLFPHRCSDHQLWMPGSGPSSGLFVRVRLRYSSVPLRLLVPSLSSVCARVCSCFCVCLSVCLSVCRVFIETNLYISLPPLSPPSDSLLLPPPPHTQRTHFRPPLQGPQSPPPLCRSVREATPQ